MDAEDERRGCTNGSKGERRGQRGDGGDGGEKKLGAAKLKVKEGRFWLPAGLAAFIDPTARGLVGGGS